MAVDEFELESKQSPRPIRVERIQQCGASLSADQSAPPSGADTSGADCRQVGKQTRRVPVGHAEPLDVQNRVGEAGPYGVVAKVVHVGTGALPAKTVDVPPGLP